jgi:peptidoglycan/LPS O-acetylase OafA/YrhL
MVAVVAVILDHLLHWPSGGFVGVDVFFVLSGFLITGLLLRELERDGRISFRMFYVRRVKRLLPAAMLTIAVTVGAAWFLVGGARFLSIATDAVWASLFGANWRFASVGTDYFAQGSAVSPLQHFWSLAVEEQFYFVWPVIMLGIAVLSMRIFRGDRSRMRAPMIAAILLLSVASVAWGAFETVTNPTVAYFSTFSRAWELGVGALLALAASRLRALPPVVGAILGWAGVVGILVSYAIVPASGGFPVPWALLPVAATALVVVGGLNPQTRTPVVLDNPVSRYVGDISYSLYLWHFPVIILLGPFLAYLWGLPDLILQLLLVLVMLAISMASYHFVEDPVRRSGWLTGTRRTQKRKLRLQQLLVGGVAALAVGAIIVAFSVDRPVTSSATSQKTAAPNAEGGDDAGTAAAGDASKALSAEITSALAAGEWPEGLTPALDDPSDDPALVGIAGACGGPAWKPAEECTIGDPAAPRLAVLIGDSIALAYVPGLAKVLGTGEWRLRIASMYACPFVDLPIADSQGKAASCAERRAKEAEEVLSSKPDLIILSTTYIRGPNQDAGGKTPSVDDYITAFQRQLATIADAEGTLVQLMPPPADKVITECYTPYSKPSDCVSRISASDWNSMARKFQASTEAAGGVFVNTGSWYCDDSGSCPAFAGSTTMKKDKAHVTSAYSEKLAPVIREALVAAGVLE